VLLKRLKMEKTERIKGFAQHADGNLLETKDLTKVFTIGKRLTGSKLVAVNSVNLRMKKEKPEIFTLAGESGSGKTTLARIILGLTEFTSGEMLYKGKDITKLKSKKEKMWLKREIQPIFQNPYEAFNPLKKVENYLFETATRSGTNHDKKAAVNDALNMVGLNQNDVLGKYPHELSGGQLQRTAIARALITTPDLLIADEPVSMIDASLRMSVLNFFKDLKEMKNVSIIYITHDLATAYYISDRIGIMYRGCLVELGPVEKVLKKPLHPYTKLLLESIPKTDPEHRWGNEIKMSNLEVKEYGSMGCKFAERCPLASEECRKEAPKDVFVDGRLVKCILF